MHIGETADTDEMQGFAIGCLNNVSGKISSYFTGQAPDTQIQQLSNCIKTALNVFKKRVHGRKEGEFTPDELRKFIQELFLQDRTISDPLLKQLIHLKRMIIGGSEDKLTKTDIENFIVFIDVLTKEVVYWRPYIQALYNPEKNSLQLNAESPPHEIEDNFKQSVSRISRLAGGFSYPYTFSSAEILIRELDLIANGKLDIQDLDKKIAVIKSFKYILSSGLKEEIHPKEWSRLFLGYSYIISFTSYFSQLKAKSFISLPAMEYMLLMLNNILNFFSLAVEYHPEKFISSESFMELAVNMKEAGWLPEKLTEKSLESIFKIVLGKIFNVNKERYGSADLSAGQLQKMKNIFSAWITSQSFLNKSFKNSRQIFKAGKTKADFASVENSLFNAQSALYNIFSMRPLYKKENKVHLSRHLYTAANRDIKRSYKNLTIYNLYNITAEFIKAGYQKGYPQKTGLKQLETEQFFIDFYPVQAALGWVKPSEEEHFSKGELDFLFAKMAVPSAKGFTLNAVKEEELSYLEIMEYLAYSFSIGFTHRRMQKVLSEKCLIDKSVSLQDGAKYDLNCVRFYLLSDLPDHISNMPDLKKALTEMNAKEKSDFIEALMHIAFETEELYEEGGFITSYQIKYMLTALYFTETTINRFDLDNDSVLSEEEIWKAFFIFEGYLRRVLLNLMCSDNFHQIPALYAYAVNKKNIPFSAVEMSKWELFTAKSSIWLHSQYNRIMDGSYWKMRLDRTELLQLYSNLGKRFVARKKVKHKDPCPGFSPL